MRTKGRRAKGKGQRAKGKGQGARGKGKRALSPLKERAGAKAKARKNVRVDERVAFVDHG